jgi:hypothetical protein
MKLFNELKNELDQESGEQTVRLSVGLSGRAAEVFIELHQSLGGPEVISRNALVTRILARVLTDDEPSKQRRTVKGGVTSPNEPILLASSEGH